MAKTEDGAVPTWFAYEMGQVEFALRRVLASEMDDHLKKIVFESAAALVQLMLLSRMDPKSEDVEGFEEVLDNAGVAVGLDDWTADE